MAWQTIPNILNTRGKHFNNGSTKMKLFYDRVKVVKILNFVFKRYKKFQNIWFVHDSEYHITDWSTTDIGPVALSNMLP